MHHRAEPEACQRTHRLFTHLLMTSVNPSFTVGRLDRVTTYEKGGGGGGGDGGGGEIKK